VVLPNGSLTIPAFVVGADGGAFTANQPLPHRDIIVQRVFAKPDQALQSLIADGPILGFTEQNTKDLLSRVSSTIETPTPQQGVLDGFIRDWLAAYAEVIGYEDGTVGVNYHFTIDQFHNEAIDKVVHDGVFPIDLTHRPSRTELAFLNDLDSARVQPGSLFDGKPGHIKMTLTGRTTPIYDITVTADLTLGQPGTFAAALTYTFTYH